ncbi:ABC-2 transporter permease [Ureibacillus manganicus]|uniref:Uncharacterized protein n=1 Tax=Ureibacillus manganicus DSM 26584 TaxID=1384049 RepID=A0A0A3HSA0_9BACL|nr:ABC-2 transporter permease [Ureibacillus manganicus]KGR75471.1 hypothetical protein CD29_17905 [Ureibacillus manganicus DSM 26584]
MKASLYLNLTEHLMSIIISICFIILIAISFFLLDYNPSVEFYIFIFNIIWSVEIISTYRRKGWESHLHTFPISKKNFVKAPMIVAWSYCLLLFLIASPIVLMRDGTFFENIRVYLFFFCISIANIAVIFYVNFRYRHREKFKGFSYFSAFVTSIIAGILYFFVVLLLGFIPLYVVPILFHIALWYSYKKCVKLYEKMDIV